MFRMLIKLFKLASIVAAALIFWVVFALWVGLYSIYSYPPSTDHPEGVTYIVSREDWEPTFNSPDFKAPPKKEEGPKGGIGFGKAPKVKQTVEERSIVKLPYVDWAYKKSLEPQTVD